MCSSDLNTHTHTHFLQYQAAAGRRCVSSSPMRLKPNRRCAVAKTGRCKGKAAEGLQTRNRKRAGQVRTIPMAEMANPVAKSQQKSKLRPRLIRSASAPSTKRMQVLTCREAKHTARNTTYHAARASVAHVSKSAGAVKPCTTRCWRQVPCKRPNSQKQSASPGRSRHRGAPGCRAAWCTRG